MPLEKGFADSGSFKKGMVLFTAVFALLLVLTWMALATGMDLQVAGFFYDPDQGWLHRNEQPWKALYEYGTIPGLALSLCALTLFFLGYVRSGLAGYRRQMLVIVLTAVVGAGLLVNVILKPYTGRPRPREIKSFGGQWEYCLPCRGEALGKGMSFPCGHCTMGFLFVTLFFLRRKAPALAFTGGIFGLAYGSLMGVARAAQGAHFATDTLWSLGIVALVSILLHFVILPLFGKTLALSKSLSRVQITMLGTLIFLAAAVITAAFLTRRPYYDAWSQNLPPDADIDQVIVQSDIVFTNQRLVQTNAPPSIQIQARGFGWINSKQHILVKPGIQGKNLLIVITAAPVGYFAELRHEMTITLPPGAREPIALQITPINASLKP